MCVFAMHFPVVLGLCPWWATFCLESAWDSRWPRGQKRLCSVPSFWPFLLAVCVPLTSPSWAAALEAKHVSLTWLFNFLCQYCWLWGYRFFKGWATFRSYLNVHLKLFWKAPHNASFCVFHAPFGRSRRQRKEIKKERDPYCPHFDVPSEM